MNKQMHRVRAQHRSERYAFDGEMETREDAEGGIFYAMHPTYGCGKSKPTRVEAIHDMLLSHGCYNIEILN